MPPQAQPLFLDAHTLLVEARFRDRPLATRLLTADAARGFTIGAGRAADAPIDVAFLPASRPANDNHVLVEPTGAGFLVNLPEAMRARLQESPTHLRVPCGEVIFDITAAAAPPVVPRPWLSRIWKKDAPYLAGVGVVTLLLLIVVGAIPSDPRSISLDDIGRTVHLGDYRLIPPAPVETPPIGQAGGSEGGGPAKAASGPAGAAGDPRAPRRETRRSTKGPAQHQDARDVVAYVEQNTILSVLGSQRSTSLHHVLSDTPALGDSAADVLGGIRGTELANAWGNGGIRISGTGTGGADTGLPMLGGPGGLNTIPGGHGTGTGPHYGSNVGTLDFRRQPRVPQIISTQLNVRGNLDKEIIRRIVRTHLNEIRYCYEQSLVRHPSLSGRVVVQFTIANTGRVIASVLQSSTIPEPALNSCVVQATRRWQYPAPDGGGLAIVSYPFQLTPAGG